MSKYVVISCLVCAADCRAGWLLSAAIESVGRLNLISSSLGCPVECLAIIDERAGSRGVLPFCNPRWPQPFERRAVGEQCGDVVLVLLGRRRSSGGTHEGDAPRVLRRHPSQQLSRGQPSASSWACMARAVMNVPRAVAPVAAGASFGALLSSFLLCGLKLGKLDGYRMHSGLTTATL